MTGVHHPFTLTRTLENVSSIERLKELHRKAIFIETLAEFIGLVEATNDDVH